MIISWFETSAEVFAVIRARHAKDMEVHSSFTDSTGDGYEFSSGKPYIETQYCFKNSDSPLLRIEQTKNTKNQKDWEIKYKLFYQSEDLTLNTPIYPEAIFSEKFLTENYISESTKNKLYNYLNSFIEENFELFSFSRKADEDFLNFIEPNFKPLDIKFKYNVKYKITKSELLEEFKPGSPLWIRFDKEGLTNPFMKGPYEIWTTEKKGSVNNILYLTSRKEMCNILNTITFEIDKDFAKEKIDKLEKEILELKINYEL